MRVIAGTFRSRVLSEVSLETTRETKDRVKESMFNSITPYLRGSTVLDLFCGSGSFLIECLMMILDRPCRNIDEEMPFHNWPIH